MTRVDPSRARAEEPKSEGSAHDDREHLRRGSNARIWLEWPVATRSWLWTLSDEKFTLHGGGDLALHFDLEGRLRRVFLDGTHYQRGLDGRMLRKIPSPFRGRGSPPSGEFTITVARTIYELCGQAVIDALRAVVDAPSDVVGSDPVALAREEAVEWLQRAASFFAQGFDAPSEGFRAAYDRVGILPPDCYRALILQATTGCRYAKCEFCTLYRETSHRRKSVEEFRVHVRAVKALLGRALPTKRGVFLGEANALEIAIDDLAAMLEIATEELPGVVWPATGSLGGFSAFTDAFDGVSRSRGDLQRLVELGLRRVHVGIESGDDEVLQRLSKPASRARVLGRVRHLKDAGVAVGAIFLAGAGGRALSREHVEQSISLIDSLELGAGDLVYVSRLHPPAGRSMSVLADGGALGDEELREEERKILTAARERGVRASPYDVDAFVYY